MADAAQTWPDVPKFLSEIREWLTIQNGDFLICEHGRLPVCTDDEIPQANMEHDAHCYHAHGLAFNTSADVQVLARSYFADFAEFSELREALAYAATQDTYVYSSPSPNRHLVYTGPLNMPRQLMRWLVAHVLDENGLADWRSSPRRQECVEIANRLRGEFQARFGNGR